MTIIEPNTFQHLINLKKLNLQGNRLTKIDSFQHLINLKILNLSLNVINEIDSNGFQGLENLEELDLRLN